MKKILYSLLLVLLFCSCDNNSKEQPIVSNTKSFILIGKEYSIDCHTTFYTYYDSQTLVMYEVLKCDKGVSITPLLNASGTPKLYQGR